MSDFDSMGMRNRSGNAGFRLGFVGGISIFTFMVVGYLATDFSFAGLVIAKVFGLFVYAGVGNSAAEQQHRAQLDDLNHLRGVRAAGIGAAMISSLLSWLGLIILWVFRDAIGSRILLEPFSMFCVVIVDIVVAISLGGWVGGMVERRYGSNYSD